MNFVAVLAALGTVIQDAPAGLSFIMNTVTALEAKTNPDGTVMTGDEKLAALLNTTEVFLRAVDPELEAELEPVLVEVEKFVESMVGIYNQMGVFFKPAPKPVVS